MPFNAAAKNLMLDELGDNTITHMSLHDADPGTDGSNELTGGSPAYARKAVTFDAAASGEKAIASALTFDVAAAATVAYVGFWDALTTGNFYGSAAVSPAEDYGSQGTFEVLDTTKLDINDS